MQLTDIIKEVRHLLKCSQKELALKIGTNEKRIANIEGGSVKKLTPQEVERLVALGFDRQWLLTGKAGRDKGGFRFPAKESFYTPPPAGDALPEPGSGVLRERAAGGFKQVPYFKNVRVAAGYGVEVFSEEPDGVYEIPETLLPNGRQIQCIKVSGYSMAPRFDDGDFIFIDIAEQSVRAEGIYVIRVNDALLVKMVQWMPGGLRLISENKNFEPVFISAEECESMQVQIIGRVVAAFTYC